MKTSFIVSFFSLLAIAQGSLLSRFQEWAQTHSIDITDTLKQSHIYSNWLSNDKYISEVNYMNLTYTLGHNAFSGYSSEEFSNLMGFNSDRTKSANLRGLIQGESDLSALATSIDWRAKGVVNPVQDQGQCGSCWAFSTIQAVESASAIKYGTLPKLSEQELVDCDTLSNGGRDHGCNGGLMDNAFTWIGKSGGVCSESAYPYTSGVTKTAGTCAMQSCSNVAHTASTNHVDVQTNSDNALMTALSQQPVSVAIEADQKAFQLYSTGVFTAACGTNLDHGVGLVGYGAMSGTDYYILRNSWGASWGEAGYIRMKMGKNLCGITDAASYPQA